VVVAGLSSRALDALVAAGPEAWPAALRVQVVTDALAAEVTPPVHGSWTVSGGTFAFTPSFPFAPGTTYRARFAWAGASPAVHEWTVASAAAPAASRVVRVEPEAAELPANLLRLYVYVDRAMRPGGAYQHVTLFDLTANADVQQPFVEVEQELWDRDRRRLTLLFDPGRIKRAVGPNVERGPVLEPGHEYELRVTAGWADVHGSSVEAGGIKRFTAVAADRQRPAPRDWTLAVPAVDTRSPLDVSFREPLDAALARRSLRVEAPDGSDVVGEVALRAEARGWRFTPRQPWRPGAYRLVAAPILEDLAGNTPARLFDTDLSRQLAPLPADRAFEIPPAQAAGAR